MDVTAESLHVEWTLLQVPTWRSGWQGRRVKTCLLSPPINWQRNRQSTRKLRPAARHDFTSTAVIHSEMNYCLKTIKSIKNADFSDNPKTLPWRTLYTTLTNLLQRLFTTTHSNLLGRNCVRTDNTEPPMPTVKSLKRIPWLFTLSKAAFKSIRTILASCPLSNAIFQLRDTHRSASQAPRPSVGKLVHRAKREPPIANEKSKFFLYGMLLNKMWNSCKSVLSTTCAWELKEWNKTKAQ